MTIVEFFDLIYIKQYMKNKDRTFKALIEGSVQNASTLSYSAATYHGILSGNNANSFAHQLIDAGLNDEKISKYFETLCRLKHNGSVKAKEQYQDKTYKEALYDQVKDKFDGITPENMSDILAKEFFAIIQTAKAESDIKALRRQTTDIGRIRTFIQKIDQTVYEMITIGRSIAESRVTTRNDHVSLSNLNQSLRQKLSQLSELSSALHTCNEPDLEEAINRVFVAIQGIGEKDFILTKSEYMLISNRNLSLHHFLDVLNQLKNEVENLSNS